MGPRWLPLPVLSRERLEEQRRECARSMERLQEQQRQCEGRHRRRVAALAVCGETSRRLVLAVQWVLVLIVATFSHAPRVAAVVPLPMSFSVPPLCVLPPTSVLNGTVIRQ
jgi:hypothetical protein